jgi:hypothetical protein
VGPVAPVGTRGTRTNKECRTDMLQYPGLFVAAGLTVFAAGLAVFAAGLAVFAAGLMVFAADGRWSMPLKRGR